jgi:hypothetical protein
VVSATDPDGRILGFLDLMKDQVVGFTSNTSLFQ